MRFWTYLCTVSLCTVDVVVSSLNWTSIVTAILHWNAIIIDCKRVLKCALIYANLKKAKSLLISLCVKFLTLILISNGGGNCDETLFEMFGRFGPSVNWSKGRLAQRLPLTSARYTRRGKRLVGQWREVSNWVERIGAQTIACRSIAREWLLVKFIALVMRLSGVSLSGRLFARTTSIQEYNSLVALSWRWRDLGEIRFIACTQGRQFPAVFFFVKLGLSAARTTTNVPRADLTDFSTAVVISIDDAYRGARHARQQRCQQRSILAHASCISTLPTGGRYIELNRSADNSVHFNRRFLVSVTAACLGVNRTVTFRRMPPLILSLSLHFYWRQRICSGGERGFEIILDFQTQIS